MMLAAELALAKVDVAVVERRRDHALVGSRAGGFHSRTIEVLDQRGVADRFLAEGQVVQVATFGRTALDVSDFPTRHPYTLGIWQSKIERILAAWIAELPVRILYGCEVTGFAQDDTGVDVEPVRRRALAGAVCRRVRRGTQRHPQGCRHRVPRMGCDDQPPDRRGRDDRGARVGGAARRGRRPRAQQTGVRDPRRRGGLQRLRAGTGDGDRTARRVRDRTHPARSARR